MEGNREVVRLQGDGNYTKLLGLNDVLIEHSSYTFKKVLQKFPGFIVVGRGCAVKAELIKKLIPERRILLLTDNTVLNVPKLKLNTLIQKLNERELL